MVCKKVNVLWHFCVKIYVIWLTHLSLTTIYTPWPTPCLLPSMVVEDTRDQSWQDEKWPCFSPRNVSFQRSTSEIYGLDEFWWKWVIFLEWSGSRAIRGSGHLALMVPRGGVMSESSEPQCSVRTLNAGSMNPHSPWLSTYIFAAWFSVCSATGEHIKNGQCSLVF